MMLCLVFLAQAGFSLVVLLNIYTILLTVFFSQAAECSEAPHSRMEW